MMLTFMQTNIKISLLGNHQDFYNKLCGCTTLLPTMYIVRGKVIFSVIFVSPIFPLIISSAKYPPVSNWSNRPSYLRGRQQLFMGVLFVHWAQVLVRITLWLAGWAPPTMLWIGIPSGALQWKDTKAQL